MPCVEAARLDPTDILALRNGGTMYVILEDFAQGFPLLQRAIELAGNDVDELLLFNYCLAYTRSGNCTEAIECNQRLVSMFPKSKTYLALGIAASTCGYANPIGITYKLEAAIAIGKEQKNAACPDGYTTQLSFDNVAEVATVIQHGGAVYPDYPLPAHLHSFLEHQIVIYHMHDSIIESPSGIISKGCNVFTGDHLFCSRLSDEFKGVPPNLTRKVLDIPVASVLQQHPNNFYHAIAEVLGRLLILRDYAFTNSNPFKISAIIVPANGKVLLEQALQLINYDQPQVNLTSGLL